MQEKFCEGNLYKFESGVSNITLSLSNDKVINFSKDLSSFEEIINMLYNVWLLEYVPLDRAIYTHASLKFDNKAFEKLTNLRNYVL